MAVSTIGTSVGRGSVSCTNVTLQNKEIILSLVNYVRNGGKTSWENKSTLVLWKYQEEDIRLNHLIVFRGRAVDPPTTSLPQE